MKVSRYVLVSLFFLITVSALSQSIQIFPLPDQVRSSFRALSVVNDSVAWVSGSKGWVGITRNGGKDWVFNQVKGFEESDFRSLYAFNHTSAVIANAGSPGNILLTRDGGKTWQAVYTNNKAEVFMDGIDFWNEKEGMVYGDPMNGYLFLLHTTDGGLTWKEIQGPALNTGEASFAASGTGIRCKGKSELIISTGGKTSRVFISSDKGRTWKTLNPPAIQGKESAGIFSTDRYKKTFIVVGGDFTNETGTTNNASVSFDNGKTWSTPQTIPRGYRECVMFISKNKLITTGPSGTEISFNSGLDWQPVSDEKGFHVVRKARKGNLIVIAGKEKLGIVTDN